MTINSLCAYKFFHSVPKNFPSCRSNNPDSHEKIVLMTNRGLEFESASKTLQISGEVINCCPQRPTKPGLVGTRVSCPLSVFYKFCDIGLEPSRTV